MENILIVDEEFSDHTIERHILERSHPGYKILETDYSLSKISEEERRKVVGVLAQIYAPMDSQTIDKFPNLRCISVYGGGYDRVDVKYAGSLQVKVSRVPDYCNDEVAEFVIMSILMLSKRVDLLRKSFYENAWGYEALERKLRESLGRPVKLSDLPRRVSGKTLFIVGYGKIGQSVARKAEGLGMNIMYYDSEPIKTPGAGKYVSLDYGIRAADFVTIHVPLTERTKYMFDLGTFKNMKKTSFLINTSRGKVVVEKDLVRALKEGLIAGAALDVFENEPLDISSELLQLENVIATPHCVYATDESIETLKKTATANLLDMLGGRDPPGLVRL